MLDEEKVKTTIEAIRPAIQADGGDIYLRGVDAEPGSSRSSWSAPA